MYCPKCGAQNHDDLAYCRECGENLQIISQVMKKHLPVALVSKLDAVFEKKNERFRRDALLGALMGISFLILSVFEPLGGNFLTILNLSMFLSGMFSLSLSSWYFLAYRRSLELRKKPSDVSLNDKSLLPDISRVGISEDSITGTTNKLGAVSNSRIASIYCPVCGVQNLENAPYCRACAANLDFNVRPQGLERYLPAFLVNKLDALIIKNENAEYKSKYKSGGILLVAAGVYLFNIIIRGLQGDWGFAGFYLVLSVSMIITGAWNLIAYRRNLEKENKPLNETSITFSSEVWIFLSENRKAGAAILISTLIVAGLAYFGIAASVTWNLLPVIIFFASIISLASFLKFRQKHGLQNDAQFFDNAASPTKELEFQDTQNAFSLSRPPMSITEAETNRLDPTIRQDQREKILTPRLPIEPRD